MEAARLLFEWRVDPNIALLLDVEFIEECVGAGRFRELVSAALKCQSDLSYGIPDTDKTFEIQSLILLNQLNR